MVSLSFWVRLCKVYAWISLGFALVLLLLDNPWLALSQALWAGYLFGLMVIYEYLDEKNKEQLAESVKNIKKKD